MDNNSANIVSDCCDTTNYYTFNGKLMWISLFSAVAVCILIASFHSYVRWLQKQRRNRDDYLTRHHPNPNPNPRPNYLVFNFRPTIAAATSTTAPASSPHRRGLERVVLKTLPTFFYNSVVHSSPLECAVCLSEFGDNDLCRVLPKCNHCFHIDCVDMWFYSHTNCPLCRTPVKPIENPVPANNSAVELAVREAGSSSGSSSGDGGGAPSSPPPAEKVVITVEETPGDPK
ncbi:RING-H2 finger protein ATL2 [Camellia lanceoleosa]|uniref:RING-H2 finger protein ATL2 n=1 Tax=Camellia lanceoleosa TaxID=1840588 RepID=A0ACC0F259_9ERIC|nr:RING-H2 finger protein ATL2 [Camellia lanceoleosa]